MNINFNKVLKNKKMPNSIIQSNFEILRDNYTLENAFRYLDIVRQQSLTTILENSQYIYSEPTSGADFLLAVMKSNDLSVDELKTQKESLSTYLSKCSSNNYSNNTHLKQLQECLEFIESDITKKSDISYIKENMIYQLHVGFLPKPTLESSVSKDMDEILQNINSHPEVAGDYELLVKQIKSNKVGVTATNFVTILTKNTAILVGLTVVITGVVVALIVGLPLILVGKMLDDKIEDKYVASYISTLNKEINKVDEAIAKNSNTANKKMLEDYKKSLELAKKKLAKYKSSEKAKSAKKKAVKEGIETMEPNVVYAEEGSDDDESLNLDLDDDSDLYDITDFDDGDWDGSKADKNDDDFLIESCCSTDADSDDLDVLRLNFSINFIDTFVGEEQDYQTDGTPMSRAQLESFNKMMRVAAKYDRILTEGVVSDTARKIANKGEEASRNVANGIKQVGDDVKHVSVAAGKIPEHLDNLVNGTLNAIHKMDKDERKKRIIEGGYKLKLFKIIRNALTLGVAWMIHPALAAVALIAGVALDTNADDKVRREILKEMEQELAICNEKIEDARGDANKQKKYELMRIRSKLQDDITRIKYRLDD